MVKWKVALLFIITLFVAFLLPIGVDMLVAVCNAPEPVVIVSKAPEGYCADNIYLGDKVCPAADEISTYDMPPLTSYDVASVLGLEGATVTVKDGYADVAEISDNVITIKSYGNLTLIVTTADGQVERNFITVDGVNVVKAKDLYALTSNYGYIKNNLVFFTDLYMSDLSVYLDWLYGYVYTFNLSGSIYGNGHIICRDSFIDGWTAPIFIVNGDGVTVRDVRFIGQAVAAGETIDFEGLAEAGVLLSFGENGSGDGINVTIENCLFENATRGANICNSDVYFKGCLFQNMSDTCISLKTCNPLPSNVTLENCVLANAVISGITNWCTSDTDDDNQCTINLKGFVDFYVWKERDSAKIVPDYQESSGWINSYFQSMLKKQDLLRRMYQYEGNYYVNNAIAVICTVGGEMRNKPTITGLAEQGVGKLQLPVNSIVATVLTTADMYGYLNGDNIEPTARVEDNEYIFDELKHGRTSK